MTDILSSNPSPRARLLRFLVPVLIAHGLLLAALPYWPSDEAPGRSSMDVRLAPSATAAPPVAADAGPGPVAPPQTPPQRPTRTASSRPPAPAPAKAPATAAVTPAAAPPVANTPATPPRQASQPPPAVQAAAQGVSAAPDTPSAEDETDWRDSYRHDLHAALARHHRYPDRARRFGLSGEVQVGFAIARDGHFDDIHLVRSSDAALLDQAALATVRRLGRFRPLPRSYSEDSWEVEVPLVYRLD